MSWRDPHRQAMVAAFSRLGLNHAEVALAAWIYEGTPRITIEEAVASARSHVKSVRNAIEYYGLSARYSRRGRAK